MNKKLLFLFCGLFPFTAFSQIGINTSSPEQTLHISGTPTPYTSAATVGTTDLKIIEPTIRIEGLNATNNRTHTPNDVNSIQKVFVTHEGDLVLKPTKSFEVLVNETSFPTVYSPELINNPYDQSAVIVNSYTFTITQESLVYIKYGINTRMFRSMDLTEGHNTLTQYFAESYLNFSATAPDVLLNKRFAEDSFHIINAFNYFPLTNMYLTSNRSFLLKPGVYTVNLNIANAGRQVWSIGSNIPGENDFDFFKVIAIPTNR